MRLMVKELMIARPLHANYHDHELSGEYKGVHPGSLTLTQVFCCALNSALCRDSHMQAAFAAP
jgi:mRNA-degrading endonuclease YafQ of YafQ-DinJ toxin-antitoxin module